MELRIEGDQIVADGIVVGWLRTDISATLREEVELTIQEAEGAAFDRGYDGGYEAGRAVGFTEGQADAEAQPHEWPR